MESYFAALTKQVTAAYRVAESARAKGYDPEDKVSIPLAKNMAERVVALVSSVEPKLLSAPIPARISELEKKYGKLDWRVALTISLEVAQQKFFNFENQHKAIETGIRLGIAYLTSGIVASPLEGFVELKIKKTRSGKDYFCVMYAGPIRSAGGTAGAVSVIIVDYLRVMLGYAPYDSDEKEQRRTATELQDYHERITNLQYFPSEEEILFLAKHLPVQIDGDPSEKIDVSNYKDLDRIQTNKIRSGPCLVMGECVAQKASKVWAQLSKWGSEFGLGHWSFLKEFVELQKKIKSKAKKADKTQKIAPVYTFISDLVAGRPVLTHPMQHGGFRLRYGRCRTTGYSAAAIHPATMLVLNKYIAIGTQLKLERPGKAASMSVCDTIEGPIVKLTDGSVVYVDTEQRAKECVGKIQEILYMGDILISFGDFTNRAHVLVPPGYCEEWWARELAHAYTALTDEKKQELITLTGTEPEKVQRYIAEPLTEKPSFYDALKFSQQLQIPLHPAYSYHWNALDLHQLHDMLSWLVQATVEKNGMFGKIILRNHESGKRSLELIGIPHLFVNSEYVVIEHEHAASLAFCTQLMLPEKVREISDQIQHEKFETPLLAVNALCGVVLRDKSGIFIGARMGRPEKAKQRKMTGDPHTLFPVGEQGGKMRSLNTALTKGNIRAEFAIFGCGQCNKDTIFPICEDCQIPTTKMLSCKECGILTKPCPHHPQPFRLLDIDIVGHFKKTIERLGLKVYPDLIKGVKGTSNKGHVPEHFAKGILRAKNEVFVNKDGTIRYDMTQLPLTHFKPKEIGTSLEKLHALGYTSDYNGNPLQDTEQILELKPQDIILPACTDAQEDGADVVLCNAARFIDELLTEFYKLPPFYNVSSAHDVVGHLVLALAPHTSAGIVGRIIGFSKTQGFYAHPMLHAATRRDCDGDEASVTLLLDALINFSSRFLPDTRGATQDAPLVLTSVLLPSEVDDMLFDLDVASYYPLEFYQACLDYQMPSAVKIEKFGSRLNTEKQYEGLKFTHDVSSMNMGVRCSSYKTIPSMQEKLLGQMELADKIRAVDASDVARLVIEKHFIRDIKGNLRKFSTQQFRCSACNSKYRRPPLIGRCTKCEGPLIFTVTYGSIVKYLEPSLSLAQKYNLPVYLKQTLELSKQMVEEVFGRDKEKQEGLGRWFG